MCNAKPGLRCNTHAVQKVNAEQTRIADLRVEIESAQPDEIDALMDSLQASEERLRAENFEYALTPDGQQELVDAIRRRNMAGEDTAALYERLGQSRALAERRKSASRAVESPFSAAEERAGDQEHQEFVDKLDGASVDEKKSAIRKERHRLKNINIATRDQYATFLNNSGDNVDYEHSLMKKIRSARYLTRKLDEYESETSRSVPSSSDSTYTGSRYSGCGRSGGGC